MARKSKTPDANHDIDHGTGNPPRKRNSNDGVTMPTAGGMDHVFTDSDRGESTGSPFLETFESDTGRSSDVD